jgi:RNA polymerase sigma factor (sigma-70 family)
MSTAPAWSLPERWDAVLEHRDRALRVARARLSDPYDVDDCVQEGMVRVVAMPNLDLGRVGPLLSTVVANVAADTHRQHQRSHRLSSKMASSVIPTAPGDEPVCDAAEARWLHGLLDTLGERERAVLKLRAEGRTVAETAAALGMTYKAAESAFTRGRNALKTLWRATLVVVGVGMQRAWRTPQVSLSTAVIAAAAVLSLAVVQGPGRSAPWGRAVPNAQAPAQTSSAYNSPSHASSDATARARSARRAGSTEGDTSRAQHVAAITPPSVRRAMPSQVRETREHGDESMQQTLTRCLKKGVTVRPSKIRCND